MMLTIVSQANNTPHKCLILNQIKWPNQNQKKFNSNQTDRKKNKNRKKTISRPKPITYNSPTKQNQIQRSWLSSILFFIRFGFSIRFRFSVSFTRIFLFFWFSLHSLFFVLTMIFTLHRCADFRISTGMFCLIIHLGDSMAKCRGEKFRKNKIKEEEANKKKW